VLFFSDSYSFCGLQAWALENDLGIGFTFNANKAIEQRVYSRYSLRGNHDHFLKNSNKKNHEQNLTFIFNRALRI
jgi:hypothetical protein